MMIAKAMLLGLMILGGASLLRAGDCDAEKDLLQRHRFIQRRGAVLSVTFQDGSIRKFVTKTHAEGSQGILYCAVDYYAAGNTLIMYENTSEYPRYRAIYLATKNEVIVGDQRILSPDGNRLVSVSNAGCEMSGADALMGIWRIAPGGLSAEYTDKFSEKKKWCPWEAGWTNRSVIEVIYVDPTIAPYKEHWIKLELKNGQWVSTDIAGPINR
jgi:hypothetical protein